MRELAILLAVAGALRGQPAPYAYIGAGGCASSNCHGGTTAAAESESRILGNEYATWAVADKHMRAFKVLEEPRGRRMADILKIADATRDRRCTVCHVVGSPENSRSDGVACEACHGAAEQWLGPHTRPNSHEASVKAGMTETRDLTTRSKLCLSCHLGNSDQQVDHELIAAGHPDLAFELDTFTVAQPAHGRATSAPSSASGRRAGEGVGGGADIRAGRIDAFAGGARRKKLARIFGLGMLSVPPRFAAGQLANRTGLRGPETRCARSERCAF